MTDDERYATGGWIDGSKEVYFSEGCDYIIPLAFAQRWKEALDKMDEDGVE